MAGTSLEFDAAAFRAEIRATMMMGLPVDEAARPTFSFPHDVVYENEDTGGDPFDWTAPVAAAGGGGGTTGPRPPVQVPCALEEAGGSEYETGLGIINEDEILLTVLDVDHALIDGFDEVEIGGNTYRYTKELPPRGLWDVTIHQIVVTARDES